MFIGCDRMNIEYTQIAQWCKGNPGSTLVQGLTLFPQIKAVNAVKYMECSALTQEGLRAVFDAAIDLVLSPKKPKPKKTCALL